MKNNAEKIMFILAIFSFCLSLINFIAFLYYKNMIFSFYSIMSCILGTGTLCFGFYNSINDKLDKIIERLNK